jgi:hypothetical protein
MASGWAMNGSRPMAMLRVIQPPAMANTEAAAANEASVARSWVFGTSPFSRACCNFRGVGSSVFDAASFSSAMGG